MFTIFKEISAHAKITKNDTVIIIGLRLIARGCCIKMGADLESCPPKIFLKNVCVAYIC